MRVTRASACVLKRMHPFRLSFKIMTHRPHIAIIKKRGRQRRVKVVEIHLCSRSSTHFHERSSPFSPGRASAQVKAFVASPAVRCG